MNVSRNESTESLENGTHWSQSFPKRDFCDCHAFPGIRFYLELEFRVSISIRLQVHWYVVL